MPVTSPFHSVPISTVPLHTKLLVAILKVIDQRPNQVAFINGEDPSIRITFKELYGQSHCFASFLNQKLVKEHCNGSFGHGDVLCQVLPNCFEYSIGYLATLMCGGIMSGASAMSTVYELERQFCDCDCSVVLTDENNVEKVIEAANKCPKLKTIICVQRSSKPVPNGVFAFKYALQTEVRPIPTTHQTIEDVCLLPYSSGTTGTPKGVMLTHRAFGTMLNMVVTHFENNIIKKFAAPWNWLDEYTVHMLPFYHIYGFGVMNMTLLTGATGIILNKFDPHVYLSTVQQYKIRMLLLVPPLVLFLAKHEIVDKYDLKSVDFVMTGAAPLGKELSDEFFARHKHIKFMAQGYGMTECGMSSHLPNLHNDNDYATVGPVIANFMQKVGQVDDETGKEMVIDPATGLEQPPDVQGEICVKSPTLMKGYYKRPDATKEIIDSEGWLHTGDIGYIDEKGYTYVVDRLKELIKVKGLQVPPAELEDLLLSHPDIKDAAVIGIPDSKTGEKPRAYVVRANEILTERCVQKFVEDKVSSYKFLIGGVEFVDDIPKSPSGKILRRILREKYAAKAKL